MSHYVRRTGSHSSAAGPSGCSALSNGHRDEMLGTQVGDLDLAIPKLRSGSFFPALLERRRRIDQALHAVITGVAARAWSAAGAGRSARDSP